MKNEKIVFEEPEKVVLREEEISEPSEDQILVETSKTLISTGTELTILTGDYPENSEWAEYGTFPFNPGYSSVGEVLEVGESVENYEVGDKVVTATPHQRYVLVNVGGPPRTLIDAVKVPDGVSDSEAAFHALATISMNGVRLSNISMGECVAVIGEGIVGQFATMFSRLEGGYPVAAVEISDRRIDLAMESGATDFIRSDREDVKDKLMNLNDSGLPDVVFESTGKPDLIPWEIGLTKPQGRFIVLSSPRGKTELDFHDEVNAPSRVIKGTHVMSHPVCETPYNPWTNERNTEFYLRLLKNGEIDVKHLLTHGYGYRKAHEAYQMLLEDRTEAMGVILDFSD